MFQLNIPEKTLRAVVGGVFLHGYPMGVIAGAELLEGSEELRQQTQGHHHRPDEHTQKQNCQISPTGPERVTVSYSTSYL